MIGSSAVCTVGPTGATGAAAAREPRRLVVDVTLRPPRAGLAELPRVLLAGLLAAGLAFGFGLVRAAQASEIGIESAASEARK